MSLDHQYTGFNFCFPLWQVMPPYLTGLPFWATRWVAQIFMALFASSCSAPQVCGSAQRPGWDLWKSCNSKLLCRGLSCSHYCLEVLKR